MDRRRIAELVLIAFVVGVLLMVIGMGVSKPRAATLDECVEVPYPVGMRPTCVVIP